MIASWATWTSRGMELRGQTIEAPPFAKIHTRARRPHPTAKNLVQLAAAVLGEARPKNLGLIVGSSSGCAAPDREFQRELDAKGWGFGSPSLFVYTLPTAAPAEVSIALGSRGPLLTVNAGTASGLTAIARGLEWVQSGRCAQVLCGVAELGVTNEHAALFLIESSGRSARASCGFGEAPSRGSLGDALSLAAALSSREATSIISTDARGYWASISLEAA
jgi:hypothetical protein